jgi:hypothetical protein
MEGCVYRHISSPKRLNGLFGIRLNTIYDVWQIFVFYQFNLTPTFVKLKSNLTDPPHKTLIALAED